MPTLSIAIQKGGSGKTTTVINLAAAFRHQGLRVLLVDMDPQANLTQALGVSEERKMSVYHLLRQVSMGEAVDWQAAIVETATGLPLLPASIELADAELELVSVFGREGLLRNLLKPIQQDYDYILIDCPPAIGMLTVNALVASDYVLMPLQAEFLPFKGVESFLKAFRKIQAHHSDLKILGLVLTRYDPRKTMNRHTMEQLKNKYGEQVFDSYIRTNIVLSQAQEAGQDIFTYSKTSNAAVDYLQLATEVLQRMKKR